MRHALLLALLAITAVAQPEYRPLFHFSPAKNWINDPNGLVYHDSEYHLFYQYNPFGDEWGHMSWGHAVSKDLSTWEELPLALAEENGIMIFSGSAVVDTRNTSGFGKPGVPPLIAVYTGHSKNLQTQNIAYSTDRGRTWTRYSGNPVIDIQEAEFRDPMVFWHEPSRRWIMVVALAKAHKVRFYASPDLKKWSALSDFGPAGAKNIPNWECPSIFPLAAGGRTKWILIIGVGDGAAAGGSGTQYFVGDFDGTKFTNDHPAGHTLWLDHGADFYAAQTWSGIPRSDGRRIVLAWMSNWKYASKVPTHPWRGQMTYPRTLALAQTPDGFRLVQNPVREIERLRREHTRVRNVSQNEANALLTRRNWRDTLDITITLHPNDAQDAGLELRKGGAHATRTGADVTPRQDAAPETRTGNSQATRTGPNVTPRQEAALQTRNGNSQVTRTGPNVTPRQDAALQTRNGNSQPTRTGADLTPRQNAALQTRNGNSQATRTGPNVTPRQDPAPEPRNGSAHATRVGYDARRGVIYIDRTHSGNAAFHPAFAARHEAPLKIQNEPIQLRILLDRNSIEVFANGGKVALTDLIFPYEADRGLSVFGASTVSLDIWTLAGNANQN